MPEAYEAIDQNAEKTPRVFAIATARDAAAKETIWAGQAGHAGWSLQGAITQVVVDWFFATAPDVAITAHIHRHTRVSGAQLGAAVNFAVSLR